MSIPSRLLFLTVWYLLVIVKQKYDPTTITTTGSSSSSSSSGSALVVFAAAAAAAAHQDNAPPPRRRRAARPVQRLHFLAFQTQPQQRTTRIITTAAVAAAARTNTGAKQRGITCISLTRGGNDDSSTITRKNDKKQQQEPQHPSNYNKKTSNHKNRRNFFQQMILLSSSTTSFVWTTTNNIPIPIIPPALAYEPDPDPLCESLYLISRVQEATVQQERFVRNATNAQELQNKMKLTLLLIEKNYKLVDQIIYCSTFIPSEHLVEATEAGNIAAQELQSAIDYVRNDLTVMSASASASSSSLATMTTAAITLDSKQKQYLIDALTTTREQLCIFLDLLPQDKLEVARARIERENQLNMQEFDGDENAGVYNPVVLPWKTNTHTSS